MNQPRLDALEVCLQALQRGTAIDTCLRLYPEHALELRPLLEAAQQAASLGAAQVPAEARAASHRRVQTHARGLRVRPRPAVRPAWLPRLAYASLLVGFVLFSGLGLARASARSLPGDVLYPVKLAAERLRLGLAPVGESRQALEDDYNQRRAEEIQTVLTLQRTVEVEFEGRVDAQDPEAWTVSGIIVRLGPDTEIEPGIGVGAVVEVRGLTGAGGHVHAERIRLRGLEYEGTVERIERDRWVVGGRTFRVDRDTRIDPGIGPGDRVRVLARVEDDGAPEAREIRRLSPGGVPGTTTPVPPATETDEAETDAVEFQGAVETIQAGVWVVSGTAVTVDSDTEIEDDPGLGDWVRVRAIRRPDGSLLALQIERDEPDQGALLTPAATGGPTATQTASPTGADADQEQEFEGEVESIQATYWVIGGRQVFVDGDTEFKDDPELGDRVRVRARVRGDGSLLALKIERADD